MMSSVLIRRLTRNPMIKRVLLDNIKSNRFLSLTQNKQIDEFKIDFENEKKEEKKSSSKDDREIKEEILKNAMKYVPVYGFSVQSILEATTESGLSPAAHTMFENGAFDLINFFYKSSNKDLEIHLENYLKEAGENKVPIPVLIREAITYRLKLLHPYIEKWPEAMSIMTFNPSYAIESIQNLLDLCDDIWHKAGDKSTDFNWYSKRLTLAVIYKSTELFLIQDTSENFTETWKFLDRRFEDLQTFSELQKSVNQTQQIIGSSFTVLKNILNIRS